MVSITVRLPTETERRLREKAGLAGLTLEGYLSQLAEKDATCDVSSVAQAPSFDEILAPVRQGFTESGMSEAELTTLFEEAREEVWQEKQAKKPPS